MTALNQLYAKCQECYNRTEYTKEIMICDNCVTGSLINELEEES